MSACVSRTRVPSEAKYGLKYGGNRPPRPLKAAALNSSVRSAPKARTYRVSTQTSTSSKHNSIYI